MLRRAWPVLVVLTLACGAPTTASTGSRAKPTTMRVGPSTTTPVAAADETKLVAHPQGVAAPSFADANDPVVQVSTGVRHSCVRRRSGHVDCWGRNDSDQLGAPSVGPAFDISATPVRASGVEDASDISAAGGWSCAVRTDGSIVCWGGGRRIEAGTRPPARPGGPAEVQTRELPDAPVVTISGIADATMVAVGEPFSCARRRAGTVACFQTISAVRPKSMAPVDVLGLRDVEQVVVAGHFSSVACARRSDGSVACFMDDDQVKRAGSFAAGPIAELTGATGSTVTGMRRIALGPQTRSNVIRACGVDAKGSVSCWDVLWPLTPHGRTGSALSFGALTKVGGIEPSVDVALEADKVCALGKSGKVTCWRDTFDCRAGSCAGGKPATLVGIDDASALAAGDTHACVLRRGDKGVACWGDATSGRVGVPSTIGSRSVAPVVVAGLTDVLSSAIGTAFSCFRSKAGVSCAGDMSYRYDWEPDRVERRSTTPKSISPIAVDELRAGALAACTVTAGKVACWGRFLEDGTFEAPHLFKITAPLHDLAMTGLTTCAKESTGSVRCWGNELYLGDGRPKMASAPFPGAIILRGAKVASLSGIEGNLCAIERAPGPVQCWGTNRGGIADRSAPEEVTKATRVAGVDDAVEVAVGGTHACARRANGSVACWGENMRGQLGSGHADPAPEPSAKRVAVHEATAVVDLVDAVEIGAGSAYSCARRATGAVVCWGEGETAAPSYRAAFVTRPLAVEGLPPSTSLAVGWMSACAIGADGKARCWGENVGGQLGDGSEATVSAPRPLP